MAVSFAAKEVEVPRAIVSLLIAAAVVVVAGLDAPDALGELTTVGLGGWQVQSSAVARQSGAQISRLRFGIRSW